MSDTTASFAGAAEQMGMRAGAGPFANALIDVATARPEIVGLTADVAKYTDMTAFAATFPDRFLNVGMAEQNLVAVCAGAAHAGLVPVATAFSVFMTRRAQDFIAMQVALPRANVKLIGSVPGVGSTFGPSHCSIEDLAMMRALPGMVVIDPSDSLELGRATTAALDHDGPVYLRQPFHRPGQRETADGGPFRIGQSIVLRKGGDVGIIAMGLMVEQALLAADLLVAKGIEAGVLKIATLKPIDQDGLAAFAAQTGLLVTAENHSIAGGLFSAVAEALTAGGIAARIEPIGVRDVFPPFGSTPYLLRQLGMSASHIAAAAERILQVSGQRSGQ